jgi:hypothetical protein
MSNAGTGGIPIIRISISSTNHTLDGLALGLI